MEDNLLLSREQVFSNSKYALHSVVFSGGFCGLSVYSMTVKWNLSVDTAVRLLILYLLERLKKKKKAEMLQQPLEAILRSVWIVSPPHSRKSFWLSALGKSRFISLLHGSWDFHEDVKSRAVILPSSSVRICKEMKGIGLTHWARMERGVFTHWVVLVSSVWKWGKAEWTSAKSFYSSTARKINNCSQWHNFFHGLPHISHKIWQNSFLCDKLKHVKILWFFLTLELGNFQ